jgi:hypothetical protein
MTSSNLSKLMKIPKYMLVGKRFTVSPDAQITRSSFIAIAATHGPDRVWEIVDPETMQEYIDPDDMSWCALPISERTGTLLTPNAKNLLHIGVDAAKVQFEKKIFISKVNS